MYFPTFNLDLIGYAAAVLTTCSFVPQVVLTYKTRDASGVSLGMYSVFTVGVALWLAYGVVLGAWPVMIANVITLALALCILVMKLRFAPRGTDGAQGPEAAAGTKPPAKL